MQTHLHLPYVVRSSCALLAGLALGLTSLQAGEIPIAIKCSPSAVMLQSVARGNWMTVHTDLPYSLVDTDADILLSGLAVVRTKSDNRGNLVAKFNLTDLKEELEPGYVTLTLTGTLLSGDTFVGSDVVRVLSVPRPQGGCQGDPRATQTRERNAPWCQD